jgi:glycosyltransferase involved in cell wall biosynthesis
MHPITTRPKVTVDITPLFEDQWTGIPVFTRRLVKALLRHGGMEVEFTSNLTRIPQTRVNEAIRVASGTFLREQFERGGVDDHTLVDLTSHFLFPSVKASFGVAAAEASTVHDLSTLFMPENHEAANVAYHLDRITDELASDEVVFCVSEATRAALVSAFPSVRSKARVLYQYVDWPEDFAEMERNLPRLGFGRYAAVLGTLEPRKNLGLLLDALSLPELVRSRLKFVVIGRKGWLIDEFLNRLPDDIRRRLIFSGFVTEFVKFRLLANAEFLVFPSIYEGFGIPAVEAMSLAKPVLASRSSSFPEVIGAAGVYFDPLSPTEFAAAFAEIEHEHRLRELRPIALEQSRLFGPERMAAPVAEWVGAQKPRSVRRRITARRGAGGP